MLTNLKLKNVAVVEEANINFCEGLNIISGETGAGKSVILDALSLLLGFRADKSLIKSGEEFLKVEGTFIINKTISALQKFFEENDIEYDNCIIISRKISIDGKNEAKINGNTVPVAYLKKLASNLIDIHSQNENLILLDKVKQLELLDNYAKIDKTNLKELYSNLIALNSKILELDKDKEIILRELDLLDFQINEIENAKIKKDEEEELEKELNLLKNSEKISNYLSTIKELFEYGNINILSILKKAENELNFLNNLDGCEDILERFSSLNIELNDVYEEILKKYNIEFNEERYNEIDSRLDLYKKLHRKYGNSYEEITDFLIKIKEKRDYILNFEENLSKLKKEKEQLLDKCYVECDRISQDRNKFAKILEKEVVEELKQLSMINAKFKFDVSEFSRDSFENNLTENGANNIEILFSANLGEDVKPLSQVASGGEISRLMLALKTIFAKTDDIPTIVFDELDTGISGEASISTAKKLAKISKYHQIIAISHLFQICSMADRNLLVKKLEENGKTVSSVKILKEEETVVELCRFLSVDGISENTLKHAEEVKKYCDDFKKTL